MQEFEIRPLHLHTLESLLIDLVSGRPVMLASEEPYSLPDLDTRSVLEWYRKKGVATWSANVSSSAGEDLVNSIQTQPPELDPAASRPANAKNRRLKLRKMEAHRFAGLHKYGLPNSAPNTYTHEFNAPITLFEGWNGSGKTSLLNAIIWTLTGELLRPQREPESAEDFECYVPSIDEPGGMHAHKLSPLTPMPDLQEYRPESGWIPADTWVELIFQDETGNDLPPIRRSQSRNPQGKLIEIAPNLEVLGIDPIAFRLGTIMPGLLPLIKVGSESELGKAVSQLTGLSLLVDLADHTRRAKAKIDKEYIKNKEAEQSRADQQYLVSRADLNTLLDDNPSLKPGVDIPLPSGNQGIEKILDDLISHFEQAKSNAYKSAKDILGEEFDPEKPELLSDLEKNISRALERVSQPQALKGAARLGGLKQLSALELSEARSRIDSLIDESKALEDLAKTPSMAARTRLYARVALWIAEHEADHDHTESCVVCNGSLTDAKDPITGRPVKTHLNEAAENSFLMSQTITRWSESANGDLMSNLPEALRVELGRNLPPHPCDLLKEAIIDELFTYDPFKGVLINLKSQAGIAFQQVIKDCPALGQAMEISLPKGCEALERSLKRLDQALCFAQWRQDNDAVIREVIKKVLGRVPKNSEEEKETITLTGKLLALQSIVTEAQPVSNALTQCGRMQNHLRTRRTAEKRIEEYRKVSNALMHLSNLGKLADEQVDQLRSTLKKEAAIWRSKIYLGAFPSTAHKLVDTALGRKGEISLFVEQGGVSAPAQHVTNASALRANLLAFFLAFWAYVLKERGGLTTLVFDDPQELLDDENTERLASSFTALVKAQAQLIITSHDPRFSAHVARLPISGGVEHLSVHPATEIQPVIRTLISITEIQRQKEQFEKDRNDDVPAREFVESCRVYLEAKLGDLFNDPSHSAWAKENPHPTLATLVQRLRPLVRAGVGGKGMFSAKVFSIFVNHPALADGSDILILMNKAHHGRKSEIRASDVAVCADDLNRLLELMEQMIEECYRWRRRDAIVDDTNIEIPGALNSFAVPLMSILVCPDLAAFTASTVFGESQEPLEYLTTDVLENSAMFLLRRSNFGFSAPINSIAIVDADSNASEDRSLVIARTGRTTLARRLVREANSNMVALTADTPDPRNRSPKTRFFKDTEIATHTVKGVIFDHTVTVTSGPEEALLVDASDELKRVEIAFKVKDESAVPLALEKQIVLGGKSINLDELSSYENRLVALSLDDGSSVFKRIGSKLPGDLSHLMQFESIGGLGASLILSVGVPHKDIRTVTGARLIIGVLYNN